ncbi:MAG: DUF5320 domain-containing protein [Candidatus Thermoplasmatota archaeon]|nr:DUF5320 domain-containing protein [Candidatus Thermoplasmatota archaeon]
MPYRDRTGPLGLGPRTGWGRGYCSRYPVTNRYWAPRSYYGPYYRFCRGRRGQW